MVEPSPTRIYNDRLGICELPSLFTLIGIPVRYAGLATCPPSAVGFLQIRLHEACQFGGRVMPPILPLDRGGFLGGNRWRCGSKKKANSPMWKGTSEIPILMESWQVLLNLIQACNDWLLKEHLNFWRAAVR